MPLPNFLIIGAAKSGTTTLYRYLCQHPQIHMSPLKEPQFFAVDEKYRRGEDWYSSLFSQSEPHQICGEASTDYSKLPQYPETADRIAQMIPKVKMIYVMRHPVDRAYAYYVHLGRQSKVQETFEQNIKRTRICLEASEYMIQIDHYLKFFPRKSFLFLMLDDLSNKPQQIMLQVFNFLGIDNRVDLTNQNPTAAANVRENYFKNTLRQKITAPLRSIPGLYFLACLLPQNYRDWVYNNLQRSFYGKAIEKQYIPPPMLPETRQRLIEEFRQSNLELAKFLGRDLSHWCE